MMFEQDYQSAMEHIKLTDEKKEELINKIFEEKKVRRTWHPVRTFVIAAVTCLILTGTALAAAGLIEFKKFKGDGEYDGFALSGGVKYFPLTEMGEIVQEAQPTKSAESKWGINIPADSWSEAEELVGIPLMHNEVLDGLKQDMLWYDDGPQHCTVHINFSEGKPASVWVTALYRRPVYEMDGVNPLIGETVTVTARLFTEYMSDSNHTVQLYPSDEELVTDEYTMSCGYKALILERRDTEQDSPVLYMALFSVDGVEYEVIVTGGDGTKDLLEKVLDGFEA